MCLIALVSATVALPKQSSLSSREAFRRRPLRKPHPVWTTAIRAVAPAADEVVAILSPPNMLSENHVAGAGCAHLCGADRRAGKVESLHESAIQ